MNLQKTPHVVAHYLQTADYQMAKNIPHWGQIPQPGSTFYKRKLSVESFIIADHARGKSMSVLFDERYSSQNSDHTISFLTFSMQTSVPPWVQHIHLWMDNAGSTNKNRHMVFWLQELVSEAHFESIQVSFNEPGHTKFLPDEVMARQSHSFSCSDVFTVAEME